LLPDVYGCWKRIFSDEVINVILHCPYMVKPINIKVPCNK